MKVIFGFTIPNAVWSEFTNDEIVKLSEYCNNNDLLSKGINDDMLYGIICKEVKGLYKLNAEDLNNFSLNKNHQPLFNGLFELILKPWMDVIKRTSESIVNLTVPEQEEKIKKYSMPENLKVEFYIIEK